ncbi:hypothetical protein L6452_32323 [Arctium lappa]|uniref:Uncharacterized protein n=1 Tax=Arctium lappa TaxID=4217 RepID=A0ACB8Z4W1_ARCLA|nr:hypothetical protein L6452_32323 [Arctium lappa]
MDDDLIRKLRDHVLVWEHAQYVRQCADEFDGRWILMEEEEDIKERGEVDRGGPVVVGKKRFVGKKDGRGSNRIAFSVCRANCLAAQVGAVSLKYGDIPQHS